MHQLSNALNPSFNKRIYTFPAFKADVRLIFDHMDDLREASRSGRISKAFAEKLMLVVSQVNGCRYCCYGHSRAALGAGVSESELQSLLALELEVFSQGEVTALIFAQHYADANGQPDPSAWQRLVVYYGEETARDILAYLRMISFGNLLGNTFDALLSRAGEKPAPGSSLWGEINVLLGVVWMPASRLILRNFKRREKV